MTCHGASGNGGPGGRAPRLNSDLPRLQVCPDGRPQASVPLCFNGPRRANLGPTSHMRVFCVLMRAGGLRGDRTGARGVTMQDATVEPMQNACECLVRIPLGVQIPLVVEYLWVEYH